MAPTKRIKRFFDLCVMDVETRQSETLLKGTKAMTMFGSVSKDEQTIIYTEMYSNTVEIGYLLHQGKSEPLIPDAKEHVTNATVLLDDGRVLLATNHESDQAYLAIYNSTTKEFTKLVEMEGESVTELVLAKDEKTVYLVTSAGVQDKLYAYTIETGMYEEINLPVTSIAQITMSRAGKLYLNGSTATKPSNLYKQNENEWEQLTDVAVLGVEEADMVEPEVIRYRSFDEKEIEGLFFLNQNKKRITVIRLYFRMVGHSMQMCSPFLHGIKSSYMKAIASFHQTTAGQRVTGLNIQN